MIIYTKHATEKYDVLKRHAFPITEHLVLETVLSPQKIDRSRLPLLIAQRKIDKTHVLRVVFKYEGEDIKIITFYPGRIKQYETRN